MKRFLLSVLFLALLPIILFGQKTVVKGRVTDRKTGAPVIAANLVLPDGTGTYSVEDGRFTLSIERFPVLVKISHISYGKAEITLNIAPKTEIGIELDELVDPIGEVQVYAKRLRILTEKDDFSIQDFAFDHENLWLLGYTNNQASKGKLWLASWFGDTITSVPVRGGQGLYRDVFGAVHLVKRDSVFQLYAADRKIILLYSMGHDEFYQIMNPITAGFAGKLVFTDIDLNQQKAKIYYLDESLTGPSLLTFIQDDLARLNKKLDSLGVQTMWTEFANRYPVKSGTKISAMLSDQVRAPVFSWRDTLFVINQYKDSLISFGPDGKLKRTVPFTYCHDQWLNGIDGGVRYKQITVKADPVGRGLYLEEHRPFGWTLLPLNTQTGFTGSPVMLPQYPDMFRITVFGNAVYFLYPEKKWPFFVRLYRYQL